MKFINKYRINQYILFLSKPFYKTIIFMLTVVELDKCFGKFSYLLKVMLIMRIKYGFQYRLYARLILSYTQPAYKRDLTSHII